MSGIRAGTTNEVFPRHSPHCVHTRGAARAAAHYIQVVLSGLFFVLLMTLSGSSGHSITASCAITCSAGSQTHIHTTTLCKLTHSHRRVSPSSLIFMLQHIRNLILIALDTQSSSCSSSSSSSSCLYPQPTNSACLLSSQPLCISVSPTFFFWGGCELCGALRCPW